MAIAESCCISEFVTDECHLERFHADKSFHKISNLSEVDLQCLYLRVPNLIKIENKLICDYHFKKYLSYYSTLKIKCCDPWTKHSKVINCDLKTICLEFALKVKRICNISIIPGDKLCSNCYKVLQIEIKNFEASTNYCVNPFGRHRSKYNTNLNYLAPQSIEYLKDVCNLTFSVQHKICDPCERRLTSDIFKSKEKELPSAPTILLSQSGSEQDTPESNTPEFTQSTSTSDCTQSTSSLEFLSDSQRKRKLDNILDTLGIPPFKRLKLSYERAAEAGVAIIQNVVEKVSEAFVNAYEVELPKFENLKEMSNENSWFKEIISNIQSKYALLTSIDEKITLLTLLPEDWTFKKISQYFHCTAYMVNEAKKLRENMGSLGRRVRKSYLLYSPEIRKEIEEYYLNDLNSAMCSGIKECIKVDILGEPPIILQKRIMLYDAKDLYFNWIKDTTHSKLPCLTFFCQLKPKQCFYAGEPGTHNICVCAIHQNLKLKLAAVKPDINYKEAIAACVCSETNKDCMLHLCIQCPSKDLVYQDFSQDIGTDILRNVTYTAWTSAKIGSIESDSSSSSRVSLQKFNEPFNEVLKSTIEDIYNMTEHHFISSMQKQHYCKCRKQIDQDTGVLVMDFAENYQFIAQNSTQGYYFNNTSATLFTAILYYKDTSSNDVKVKSFCVISDSTVHQAYSVHAFQEAILDVIKREVLLIKYLIYYSDGAPTQFKNKNHLINVCHHQQDFGIIVKSYNFFGTSHGKSASDGIGASAKRTARRAALQGIRIMTAQEMYDYLQTKTDSNIKFLYVPDKEVVARGKYLDKRFRSAKTIKNTRRYHAFEPIDVKTMRVKLYSFDTESQIVEMI